MFEVPLIFYRVVCISIDEPENYISNFEGDLEAFAYFNEGRNKKKHVVKCVITQKGNQLEIEKKILPQRKGWRR